jgi:hypothetical protein
VFNSNYAGMGAGRLDKKGYCVVKINCAQFFSHRIIYAMFYSLSDGDEIDHRNGDKADNRLNNLRKASFANNLANRGARADNKLGVKGVRVRKGKNFESRIRADGNCMYLGAHPTLDEAKAAYDKAALELHGEFFHP